MASAGRSCRGRGRCWTSGSDVPGESVAVARPCDAGAQRRRKGCDWTSGASRYEPGGAAGLPSGVKGHRIDVRLQRILTLFGSVPLRRSGISSFHAFCGRGARASPCAARLRADGNMLDGCLLLRRVQTPVRRPVFQRAGTGRRVRSSEDRNGSHRRSPRSWLQASSPSGFPTLLCL